MENINIAEILKDCPQGMKLYSPIFGDVYLNKIRPHLAIVVTTDKEQEDFKEEFLYDGRYGMNGECMLFPSKDQRDWNKFHIPFKDGDIVTWKYRGSLVAFIYKERTDIAFVKYHFVLYTGSLGSLTNGELFLVENEIVLATEEEKQKLFDAIEKNGYKWNAETKTLEKLVEPKFKVGDIIQDKYGYRVRIEITEVNIDEEYYGYTSKISRETEGILLFKHQDAWELVPNYKFDITTLVPFETKVLVRNNESQIWRPAIWGYYAENCGNYFQNYLYGVVQVVGGSCWKYCIPYEGNEHLLGKKDDCDEFYKTWKD